jgi:hypothetical protein
MEAVRFVYQGERVAKTATPDSVYYLSIARFVLL